jgi:hypothetical protein
MMVMLVVPMSKHLVNKVTPLYHTIQSALLPNIFLLIFKKLGLTMQWLL